MKKLNVVLCGLKFGASFVPIYRDHPDIESVGIFDTDEKTMKEVSEHYHIEKMYHSFDEVLNDDKVNGSSTCRRIVSRLMALIRRSSIPARSMLAGSRSTPSTW